MTESLKAYMPPLARLLGTIPGALYERQRSLVRAGLLDAGSGWGPGSGVRTTAGSVALVLISTLSSESLTVSETRAGEIADAAPPGAAGCPLTSMRSFRDALTSILTSKAKSRRVIEISVSRTAARATIVYRDLKTRKDLRSEFVGPGADEPGLRVVATLARGALQTIADDVGAMIGDRFDESAEEGVAAQ